MEYLTKEQLDELRGFDTPTISNAIELFNIRPRTEGFMGPEVRCILPCEKPFIGYVCTAKMSAMKPPTPEEGRMINEYYRKVKETPSPCITVIQDMDPKPIGSMWGEVHASIHAALGCAAVVTNGGVRDLDEVQKIGFGLFASCVLVSHAYDHIIDYDCPVEVGGLVIKPGDLLHADKHGVILIPNEIAPKLADACRRMQYAEEPVIKGCQSKLDTGIEVEEIIKLKEEMARRKEMETTC